MGIAERKEREKLELKELILLKAKQIVEEEGHQQLSIRSLAKAVEYSPATIYLYFKDKDEILFELMELGFTKMANALAPAFKEKDPLTKLHKIALGYAHFGLNYPDWYDLMFRLENPMIHLKRCNQEWCQGIELFETMVAICQELLHQQKDKQTEPRILALQLWSRVHGLVCLGHSNRLEVIEEISMKHIVEKTIHSSIQLLNRGK